jgi:hypothetical protein
MFYIIVQRATNVLSLFQKINIKVVEKGRSLKTKDVGVERMSRDECTDHKRYQNARLVADWFSIRLQKLYAKLC